MTLVNVFRMFLAFNPCFSCLKGKRHGPRRSHFEAVLFEGKGNPGKTTPIGDRSIHTHPFRFPRRHEPERQGVELVLHSRSPAVPASSKRPGSAVFLVFSVTPVMATVHLGGDSTRSSLQFAFGASKQTRNRGNHICSVGFCGAPIKNHAPMRPKRGGLPILESVEKLARELFSAQVVMKYPIATMAISVGTRGREVAFVWSASICGYAAWKGEKHVLRWIP